MKKKQKKISRKIKKIMDEYKKTGKIGRIKPKSKKHAQKIAAAIAYSMYDR